MYDSLYGLATRSTPPVNPMYCQNRDIDSPTTTDPSFPQRSSSCIQRLDRPQIPAMIVQLHSTTQPTPVPRIKHLTVSPRLDLRQLPSSTIPAIYITHLAEDPNTTATDFTHTFVNTTINCHLCYICHIAFCFLHCLWLSLLARLNLKHLRGRHAYRLRNNTFINQLYKGG